MIDYFLSRDPMESADANRHYSQTRVRLPGLGVLRDESSFWHIALGCRRFGCVSLLERISIDPAIRFGKPCIRGTRISVGDILGYLAGGMSEDQLLKEFPQLTREDIRACLTYAAERERRTIAIPVA